jgi:hypothetical protein
MIVDRFELECSYVFSFIFCLAGPGHYIDRPLIDCSVCILSWCAGFLAKARCSLRIVNDFINFINSRNFFLEKKTLL